MRQAAAHDVPEAEVQAAPAAPVAAAAPLLELQRQVGNRATAAMILARKEAAKTLRCGATGAEVKDLQMRLDSVDEVPTLLLLDGVFGQNTQQAVKEFQQAHPPLKVTGAVDAATAAEILAAIAEPQDPLVIAKKVFGLGAAAYERGRYGHAYDYFTRAGELAPRPGLLFSRAQALRRLGGRRTEAIALYEQYLATEGGERRADAEAFVAQLKAPAKTGDDEKDTATAKAIFEKGAALYDKGDYGHALDEFERAGELVDRPGLSFSKAQALRRIGGRRAEAIALYEEYLSHAGGSREKDAREFIDQLRGTRSGDADADKAAAKASFGEGAKAYEAGKFGQAADRFAKSADLYDSPGLLFSQAQALRRKGGHRDEAIALYKLYLAHEGGERQAEAQQFLDQLSQFGAAE